MLDYATLKRNFIEAKDVRLQLLNEINDYTIYCCFLGREIGMGEFIHSPIRVDNTPSFNLYYPRDSAWEGQIMYKDFSGSSGSVFMFVKEWAMYNENIYLKTNPEIVDYIRQKLQLGPGSFARKIDAPPPVDTKTYLFAAYPKYTRQHEEYLNNICVDLDLAMNVYYALPCESLMNEHQQVVQDFRGTVTFAYALWRRDGSQGFKLYQPFEENFIKFFIHTDADIPQGFWQCKGTSTLIITKAMKDIMVIQSNLDEWIDTIAPHGEGYSIRPEWLTWYLQYDRIILMYDPDLAGIKGMNKLRKALLRHPEYKGQKIEIAFAWDKPRILKKGKMVVPVKDFSDMGLVYGRGVVRGRLKQIIYE